METELAKITALIGDPVRTAILWTLQDGKAYTATEMSICANTSPQNISIHLGKLTNSGLLNVVKQGRHRYYRLASQEVAYAMEAIANLIPEKSNKKAGGDHDSDLKYCRICYDHLAGEIGVQLADQLFLQNMIILRDNAYDITKKGDKFFRDWEIDTGGLKKQRRIFAKPCLDWTERKYHLAGSLGAALLERMASLDWIRRKKNSRAYVVTAKGQSGLYDRFRIAI